MTDVKNYIIALFVIAIIRWITPKFGNLVNWLIIKSVHLMEKLIKGSKLGEKRKKYVLKLLKIFGVKSTRLILELIDSTVDIMNNKQDDIKTNITSNISDNVDTTINKLSK